MIYHLSKRRSKKNIKRAKKFCSDLFLSLSQNLSLSLITRPFNDLAWQDLLTYLNNFCPDLGSASRYYISFQDSFFLDPILPEDFTFSAHLEVKPDLTYVISLRYQFEPTVERENVVFTAPIEKETVRDMIFFAYEHEFEIFPEIPQILNFRAITLQMGGTPSA